MSDTMLLGVLRMPIADGESTLTLRQFINRARQAADRIEADAERIAALEAALEQARGAIEALRSVDVHSALTEDDADAINAKLDAALRKIEEVQR